MGEINGKSKLISKVNQGNLSVLVQLKTLVLLLDEREYAQTHEEAFGASVGQHLRHILEFYLCLFKGLEKGEVDYDARERDARIENSLEYSKLVITKIQGQVEKANGDHKLILKTNLSEVGSSYSVLQTNLQRELLYTLEHAIHHMAIIKMIVNLKFPTIELDKNFGIAFSTIRHKSETEKAKH